MSFRHQYGDENVITRSVCSRSRSEKIAFIERIYDAMKYSDMLQKHLL